MTLWTVRGGRIRKLFAARDISIATQPASVSAWRSLILVLATLGISSLLACLDYRIASDAADAPVGLTAETTRADEATESRSDTLRRGQGSRYWAGGATLRVRFLDGNQQQQGLVRRTVPEWTRYANITFEFVTSGHAEIRISFRGSSSGAVSVLGTDALNIDQRKPTLAFEWVERRTILHEFGHILGLIEEQLNPRARIGWNKDAIYKGLSGPPNNWSREQIDAVVFRPVSQSALGEYREFDPDSIMTIQFPKEWTGGVPFGRYDELSPSDKALIARLYPGRP